ncbi:hypothetical protein L665_02320 [Ralstonia solanacearum SD54]|nr:hypothetical protein F504_677 [Ralstonia pseudosolanacearum FQY_4]ANH34131.1 hypothetical protein A3768_3002 [Ralstonia solanacearum]ARU22378.1 Amino-acid acetyltransferase (N-acetylglutamate synthase) [Ralstonia solanacearum]ESS48478.1 hypothetical protein L665_02320 [Ralstonia solanacearum SD54]
MRPTSSHGVPSEMPDSASLPLDAPGARPLRCGDAFADFHAHRSACLVDPLRAGPAAGRVDTRVRQTSLQTAARLTGALFRQMGDGTAASRHG